MIDKYYTIKTNKGYVNRNIYKDITKNIADAVKFYSKEKAEEHKEIIRKELKPEIMLVTCKYEVEKNKGDNLKMKYFEIKGPYYALLRANNEDKAIREYNNNISVFEGDIKEISEDEAFGKFCRACTEDRGGDDLISTLVKEFESGSVLLIDGNLL